MAAFARHAHLHQSHFNFEGVLIELARNPGIATERPQADRIAFGNVLYQPGAGVFVSAISAGGVRHH